MRGRNYLKHTINHIISSGYGRDEGHKASSMGKVAHYKNYLKLNPNATIQEKITMMENHHLNQAEINAVLILSQDDEMCKTYCGKTIEELKKDTNKKNMGCLFIFIVFIFIIICIIK